MLFINEIFGPTIQGEGKTAGTPCVFVRLAYCNLKCIWCDTPYTWNFNGFGNLQSFEKKDEVIDASLNFVISRVLKTTSPTKVRRVVISGGEPLIQEKELKKLINSLVDLYGFEIEIETNGTFEIDEDILKKVFQINCSPKLSNSGNKEEDRIKAKALTQIAKFPRATFKFVYSTKQDGIEILSLVKRFEIKEVYVMPEGRTLKELKEKEQEVKAFCSENGFIFSPRLHIEKFGGVRGV